MTLTSSRLVRPLILQHSRCFKSVLPDCHQSAPEQQDSRRPLFKTRITGHEQLVILDLNDSLAPAVLVATHKTHRKSSLSTQVIVFSPSSQLTPNVQLLLFPPTSRVRFDYSLDLLPLRNRHRRHRHTSSKFSSKIVLIATDTSPRLFAVVATTRLPTSPFVVPPTSHIRFSPPPWIADHRENRHRRHRHKSSNISSNIVLVATDTSPRLVCHRNNSPRLFAVVATTKLPTSHFVELVIVATDTSPRHFHRKLSPSPPTHVLDFCCRRTNRTPDVPTSIFLFIETLASNWSPPTTYSLVRSHSVRNDHLLCTTTPTSGHICRAVFQRR